MAGPWEKYQAAPAPVPASSQPESGPWMKYQASAPAPAGPSQDYSGLIQAAAQKYQLDPRMLQAQMTAESSGNAQAVSPKGARGLFQLMPATATDLGVTDPHDPAQSIEGGAKYMRQLLDRYKGNTTAALAAYNWGMGNVDRQGLSRMPAETRDYIAKIRGGMGDPDVPLPNVAPETRFDPTEPPEPKADTYGNMARRAVAGIGRGGVGDMFNAVTQLGAVVVPDVLERAVSPTDRTVNEIIKDQEAAYQKWRKEAGGGDTDWWRLAGNVANPATFGAGMLRAPGVAAKAVQSARAPGAMTTAADAATRGAVGSAFTPVDEEKTGGVLGQKAMQMGAGAVAGPVAEAVGRGVAAAAGRGMGFAAKKLASKEVKDLMRLSEQYGIDLLAGDYDTNRKVVRGLEARLINAQVPFLAIDLRGQQQQGMAAAQKLVEAQSKEMQSLAFASIDKIKQIAAGDSKRAAEARAVLKMASEAPGDARRMIQASGNLKWLRMKLGADSLYDDVERLAGNADVAPTQTLSALDNLERKMTTPGVRPTDYSQDSARLVQKWRGELDISPENLPDGTTAVPPNTYMHMREFLTDIEKRIEDATQPGGLKSDALWMKDVAKAVRADMDAFAQSKPALAAANARANKFYDDHVVPFQADTLAKALKSDNPDNIYSAFIRQGASWKGDVMQQKLYKALDEKGKAAVRAGVLEDAFRQATDPEHFSPVTFNKVLRQTGYEAFFSGAARSELDGLLHIMDRISRSDPARLAGFTPMVGTVVGAGVGAGALAAPGAVASALAATGALKWLVTSDAGKRLLYSANLLKPGAPGANEKWARLLDDMNKLFGASAGKAAGLEVGNEGSVIP